MDDLEIVKENVQPLAQGRKLETLKAALNCEDNSNVSEIKEKRESIRENYEIEIKRLKDDEDQLFEKYHEYINWIEQNYPKGGKEANFSKVLQNCIQSFFRNAKFKNDERMLSIFLKYTNIVDDPISVFDFFYKVSFAKQLSRFYIDWAYHLEMQKNFQKALKVIKVGLKNEAQPIADLQRSLNDLEVRTMRFTLQNPTESIDDNTEDRQRKALNKLRPILVDRRGKVDAPIHRTGIATSPMDSGINKIIQNHNYENNVPIKIYVEESNDNEEEKPKITKNLKLQLGQNLMVENEIKPEKWSGNCLSLKKNQQSINNGNQKFEIFVETNQSTKLKSEQNQPERKILVAIFEDKAKLKQYIWYGLMGEIYRDGTEYSFEEIRYRKWLEHRKLKKMHQDNDTKEESSNMTNASHEETKNHTENATKQFFCDSVMVQGMFNGTLSTTRYLDKSVRNEWLDNKSNGMEHFNILSETLLQQEIYDLNKDRNDSGSGLSNNKDNNVSLATNKSFQSCSSSTPLLNKTMKSRQNMAAARYYDNSHFINGITTKLSTIEETSREDSKSSSSSSGTMSSVGHQTTIRKIFADQKHQLDPFDDNIKQKILSAVADPIEFRKNYVKLQVNLPKIGILQIMDIREQKCIIIGLHSMKMDNGDPQNEPELFVYGKLPPNFQYDADFDYQLRSLKVCHELDYWEFYLYDELERRLLQHSNSGSDIELSVMALDSIVFYQNGYLAWLDVNPKYSLEYLLSRKTFHPLVVALATMELIIIIQKLHDCEIIHSNICTANVSLYPITNDDIELLPKRTSFTKLIDFSNAIDMWVFPEDTTFKNIKKNGPYFEILENKPWNYQVDWIGFLNCVHQMAFHEELKVSQQQLMNKNNQYETKWIWNKSFTDYGNDVIYGGDLSFLNDLFDLLLNLQENQKPDLNSYVDQLAEYIHRNKVELRINISKLFYKVMEKQN